MWGCDLTRIQGTTFSVYEWAGVEAGKWHCIYEVCEYKKLGAVKNYVGSFCSNVTDNIEKTIGKGWNDFSSKFDRPKTNPLVYIKFWKQACLPSLLFGSELFTLTPSLLLKLERCQLWFLKNVFYVPSFAHSTLILKL